MDNSVPFYKNTALYAIVFYSIGLYTYFFSYGESIRKKGIIGDKFINQNNQIDIGKIVSFPHGYSTVPDIFKSIFTTPIGLYILLFSIFYPTFMGNDKGDSLTYFYALGSSYLIMLLLYLSHVFITRKLVGTDNITIADEFKTSKAKQDKYTYSDLYKTQWNILFYVSPVYVFSFIFFVRQF